MYRREEKDLPQPPEKISINVKIKNWVFKGLKFKNRKGTSPHQQS